MFSKAKDHMVPVAVFEVSSGSVGGAHALVSMTKNPSVLLAQTRIAATNPRNDITQYIDDTVQRLESVIAEVSRTDIHHPKQVSLILAAPWYVSQTRTISYTKNTPFLCTKKLVDELVDKEIQYILTHNDDPLGELSAQYEIVERQISRIILNGYATDAPFGKHVTTLDINITVSVAPKVALERFKSALTRTYGPRHITVTTAPYAAYIVARDHFPMQDECMILDIGEAMTDVAFVKNGLFMYEHSFPVGSDALYRTIEEGGHSAVEARSLLESYRLDKTNNQTVETMLTSFKAQWQTGLQQILDSGHFGFCLPDECFVVAEDQFGAFFSNTIENDPFIQHSCSRGIVHPTVVTPELLLPMLVSLDHTPVDVSVGIGVVFTSIVQKRI